MDDTTEDKNDKISKSKTKSLMMSENTDFEQVRKQGLDDDPLWNRDISVIFCKYMKSTAIFDILANVPILIYDFEYNFTHTEEDIRASLGTSTFFGLVQMLKFLRLLHISTYLKTAKNSLCFFINKIIILNIHTHC